ncbi:Txe/YoeB family addiction module toxin [Flavobacterium sp.]|jgi:toxin YoeB|uniref:Txe/YoeB family addiction module toxin n=1 Tax=Flavobacterium sp. TaxID=239 RepID=UPI0037BF139B
MAKYIIELTDLAKEQLQKHKKSGNKSNLNKISKIFEDLENHPFTGIGNPEQLKYSLSGFWSRKINQKDRIIYSVNDTLVLVEVISAMGHYSDK